MSKIDDGGSISPQWAYDKNGVPVQTTGGIAVRDHFASCALMGLLAQSNGTAMSSDLISAARWAYQMADAMIATRTRSETDNG